MITVDQTIDGGDSIRSVVGFEEVNKMKMELTAEEVELVTNYRRLTAPGKKLLNPTMAGCVACYGDGKIMFSAWKCYEEEVTS